MNIKLLVHTKEIKKAIIRIKETKDDPRYAFAFKKLYADDFDCIAISCQICPFDTDEYYKGYSCLLCHVMTQEPDDNSYLDSDFIRISLKAAAIEKRTTQCVIYQ